MATVSCNGSVGCTIVCGGGNVVDSRPARGTGRNRTVSADGERWCEVRVGGRLRRRVESWAEREGVTFETALLRLVERGLAAKGKEA